MTYGLFTNKDNNEFKLVATCSDYKTGKDIFVECPSIVLLASLCDMQINTSGYYSPIDTEETFNTEGVNV